MKKMVLLLSMMLALIAFACTPAAQPVAPSAPAAPAQPKAPATAVPAAAPTAVPVKPGAPATVAAPTPPSVAEKPKYGGILRQSQRNNPPDFDTHQNSTTSMLDMITPAYDGLVQNDPKDLTKIVPDLAERWEVSADGLTYTFYLHKGVLFHDGVEFISADAKASLDRIYNPPEGVVSIRSGSFSSIKSVDIVDKYTLKVTLKRVQASLLVLLASSYQQMFPKHILDVKGNMKQDVVGTGPFMLKAYKPGVSWEMVKNPKYFSPLAPGQPYLDGIIRFIIPDQSTQFAAFRTGQLDYYIPTAVQLETLRASNSPIISEPCPTFVYEILGYNMTKAPFNDLRVRRALNLAVSRETGVKVIKQGAADIGGYEQPGSLWALPMDELLKQEGYGKDKTKEIALAKELLTQAGFPNGFKTTILSRTSSDAETLGIFLKDQIAKIGVDATMVPRDDPAYYKALAEKNYDTYAFTPGTSMADPDAIFGEWVLPGAGRNYEGYNNPKIVELYEKQSQTLDPQARSAIVMQMHPILHADVPKTILYWGTQNNARWPYVKGLIVQVGTKHSDLRWDHIWLDK